MARIDDIKRREAAATEEPWYVMCKTLDPEQKIIGVGTDNGWSVYLKKASALQSILMDDNGNLARDCAFIAHSRADIPWLLERVAELRAVAERCDVDQCACLLTTTVKCLACDAKKALAKLKEDDQ